MFLENAESTTRFYPTWDNCIITKIMQVEYEPGSESWKNNSREVILRIVIIVIRLVNLNLSEIYPKGIIKMKFAIFEYEL